LRSSPSSKAPVAQPRARKVRISDSRFFGSFRKPVRRRRTSIECSSFICSRLAYGATGPPTDSFSLFSGVGARGGLGPSDAAAAPAGAAVLCGEMGSAMLHLLDRLEQRLPDLAQPPALVAQVTVRPVERDVHLGPEGVELVLEPPHARRV